MHKLCYINYIVILFGFSVLERAEYYTPHKLTFIRNYNSLLSYFYVPHSATARPPLQLAFIIVILITIIIIIIIIIVVVVVVVQNLYTLFPFTQCGEYGHLAASCRNSSGSSTVTGSSADRRSSA